MSHLPPSVLTQCPGPRLASREQSAKGRAPPPRYPGDRRTSEGRANVRIGSGPGGIGGQARFQRGPIDGQEAAVRQAEPQAARRVPETLPDHEERYLARQGYLILKFFLHVSKKAQKERFLERLDRPEKNWKFSLADAQEREHWNAYARAYEDMIRVTAAPHAPWYVVPADKKWFTRLVVAAAADESLDRLKLAYPKVDEAKK
jgi:hypothetical protein